MAMFLFWNLTFFTFILGEGHYINYVLKRLATNYHCAKFGDCSFHRSREKFNVWVYMDRRMVGRPDFIRSPHCHFLETIKATVTKIGIMVVYGLTYLEIFCFVTLTGQGHSDWCKMVQMTIGPLHTHIVYTCLSTNISM